VISRVSAGLVLAVDLPLHHRDPGFPSLQPRDSRLPISRFRSRERLWRGGRGRAKRAACQPQTGENDRGTRQLESERERERERDTMRSELGHRGGGGRCKNCAKIRARRGQGNGDQSCRYLGRSCSIYPRQARRFTRRSSSA